MSEYDYFADDSADGLSLIWRYPTDEDRGEVGDAATGWSPASARREDFREYESIAVEALPDWARS